MPTTDTRTPLADRNCDEHQTWDFDCPVCARIAAARTRRYANQRDREIRSTMNTSRYGREVRPGVSLHS